MTILQSLFGGRQDRQRDALVDLLLMAALADGELSLADLDRIARAIETHDELRGYDWDEVKSRAKIVAADAPLFGDTRDRLAREITDPDLRRFGLKLAARCCRAPLAEEEKALLHRIAELFEVRDKERAKILRWTDADPVGSGYLRCGFNDPAGTQRASWADALAKSEDDSQLAMLTFKATATRAVMSRLSDKTELLSVGELVAFDAEESLRVDAYLRAGERTFLARFLAQGEALFPREHELLPALIDRVDSSVSIYVGYAGALPPPDEAALRRIAPERLRVEHLDL
ncbi:MAG: TerB family tellurite resistance protein [Deltaproteobacteria bacterium]|nr:TerB family tellurite resistance protein [Deltaproteobacteria bacterium]